MLKILDQIAGFPFPHTVLVFNEIDPREAVRWESDRELRGIPRQLILPEHFYHS